LVGVIVFVFYQFNTLNFNPSSTEIVLNSIYKDDYKVLEQKHFEIEELKVIVIEFFKRINSSK